VIRAGSDGNKAMSDYPGDRIAGVILAGGRARRMGGRDKGLLSLAGRPLVAYGIRSLRPQVGEIIINANRNISDYQALGYGVVSDCIDDFCGPLAGMLSAMNATDADYLLTVPCDSPLLPADYARRMYAALAGEGAELSVAHDGERLQPVFALLSIQLLPSLRDYLARGERKIDRWFARHRMALTDFSDHPEMFRNINTPAELASLEREIMVVPHHHDQV
jgi:molybdopterin-guanine dinucleotide biosynthesis protein A